MDRKTAALRIQRFLRGTAFYNSIRSLSSRLRRYKVLERWDPSADFKVMMARSQCKWVVRDFKKFVTLSMYMILRKVVRSGSAVTEEERMQNFNIRILLASFLIANRPENCFEVISQLERKMQASAAPVFDFLCALLQDGNDKHPSLIPWLQYRDILRRLNVYLQDFKDWKVPDDQKLYERIKHGLIALYRAESHLTEQVEGYQRMKQEFREQKAKLRAKLAQIAGTQGLAKFDELLRQERLYPEEDDSAAAATAVPASPLPPSTNASGLSSLPGRMTNEQLAHELLLDPTFKLDVEGAGYIDNDALTGVRESFKIAFWNSLVDDLKINPPCYIRVIKVLGEVRDGLIDLSPSIGPLLREKINTGYISQMVDMGLMDWPSCVAILDGIVSTALDLQGPQRKEETASQWAERKAKMQSCKPEEQPEAFCANLEYVLAQVNVMRVDAANQRLRNVAHIIQQHGIEYERAHMNKKIEANKAYLQRTPEWIFQAIVKLSKEDDTIIPSILQGEGMKFQMVHSAAALGLVTAKEPFSQDRCPETLFLDVNRLKKLQRCFRFDVYACCCIRLAVEMIFSKGKTMEAKAFIQHLTTAFNTFDASNMDIEGAKKVFRDSFMSELSEAEKGLITACVQPYSDQALATLLEVPEQSVITVTPFVEKAWHQIVVMNSEERSPYFDIRVLKDRIVRNTKMLRRIILLNRKVHTQLYNKIIPQLAAKAKSLNANKA